MAAKQQNFGDDASGNSLGSRDGLVRRTSCGTAARRNSARSFGTDDFVFYSSSHCLPSDASMDAIFTFQDAPVYRDLAHSAPCVFAPVDFKSVRVQSCFSEPARADKPLPPPVPEVFVLEKSHFMLKDVPLDGALDGVLKCLNNVSKLDSSVQCDCELVRKDFKIRGMVRSGFDNVDFRVSVFRSSADGQMALPLVEFQRRSGDLFLFRRFFSSVAAALTGKKKPTFGLGRVPPIMMDLGDEELNLEDEISTLADLLDSKYVDMQLEGVRAMGEIINQTSSKQLCGALSHLMKSILRLVESKDRELRCAVVSLIARTCTKLRQHNTADAEELMAEFAAPIVRAMQKVRLSYVTAHTQRECARVLSTVSEKRLCGEQIMRAGGEATLRQCKWTFADATTKSFAETALRNLIACR